MKLIKVGDKEVVLSKDSRDENPSHSALGHWIWRMEHLNDVVMKIIDVGDKQMILDSKDFSFGI